MERLTYKVHDGGIFVKGSDVKTFDVEDEIMHTGNAIRKLATYEDTGLTTEQIIEMDKLYAEKCKELAELKKQIPPCKVGDEVYIVEIGEFPDVSRDYVNCIYLNNDNIAIIEFENRIHDEPLTEFGKTVFLTQSEAKEALKRKEENHAGSI